MRMLAGLTAGLFVVQLLAGVALAAKDAEAAQNQAPLAPLAAPEISHRPRAVAPPPPTTLEVTSNSFESALDAVRQGASGVPQPKLPATWEELEAAADAPHPLAITPMADTDDNDFRKARWMNGSTQFLGESLDGTLVGSPPGRTDIDWYRFPLSFTATSAGKIDFDLGKSTADELEVVIYTYPRADPDTNSQVARYEYMNKTQNATTLSHFTVTAYEDSVYLMLLITPGRNGCCVVTYAITNIAFSSMIPIDDNNNRTRAEAYNPLSKPTNREVEQNADLFDVFELTNQFSPQYDKTKGDYAFVTLSSSLVLGRTGMTDYNNTSAPPPWLSDGDTVSQALLWLIYQDKSNVWHTILTYGIPGEAPTISALINGSPVYAGMSAALSYLDVPGVYPTSSIPGWVRYSITGFTVFEDLAPRAVAGIPDRTAMEDDAASGASLYDLTGYFTDDHDNGFLVFSVLYNQQPSKMAATINGNFLSVSNAQADWTGNNTLRIRAFDRGYDGIAGNGDDRSMDSNYFYVEILPVNDPPSITSFGGQSSGGGTLLFFVDQGGSLTLSTVVYDVDGYIGQSLSMTPSLAFGVFDTVAGTLTLNPANADVGVYNATVTVRDSGSLTDSVPIRITVRNVNDEPRFVRVGGYDLTSVHPPFVATQGQLFTLRLEVSDDDYLIGVRDNLQYAADKTFITLTRTPSDFRFADASFTPTNAQVGALTVKFSVTDGALGQFDDNINVTITVANVNDAPALVSVATTTRVENVGAVTAVEFHNNKNPPTQTDGARQGQAFTMTVVAGDIDVTENLGDSLSFSTDQPSKFTVRLNPDGLSADITFTPTQADAAAGTVNLTVFVNDTGVPMATDSIVVRIDILNVNDPPALAVVRVLNLTEDEEFVYSFVAADPDGDPITFSSDSILFPVDSATGLVEFTPTNDLIEGADLEFDVTITVRDNHAGVSNMKVHIAIVNVNDAPSLLQILNPVEGSSYPPGEVITFTGDANDVDKGDKPNLVFRWFADDLELGEGKSITHALENPAPSPKLVTLRLQVSDTAGASANLSISISIAGTVKPSPGPGAGEVLAIMGAAAGVAAVAARLRRR